MRSAMSGKPIVKYEMIINGNSRFCTLGEAAQAYDSGFAKVSFGKLVLLEDGASTRSMTAEDQQMISNAADDISASK